MKTEFEVKFYPVNNEVIITKLKNDVQAEVKTIIAVYNRQKVVGRAHI